MQHNKHFCSPLDELVGDGKRDAGTVRPSILAVEWFTPHRARWERQSIR
jgi:hypothetical protein